MSLGTEFDGCGCGAGARHLDIPQRAQVTLIDGTVVVADNHSPDCLTSLDLGNYPEHMRMYATNPLTVEIIAFHPGDMQLISAQSPETIILMLIIEHYRQGLRIDSSIFQHFEFWPPTL